ncbi:hypothetical protein [Kiritimatiella glycovorans]|uniref:Uncharacterized protein n=1 Tax=Kiritimatiella glycovorans TaxID=1307763 RepID=A0A0G3EL06_9BACT|nr:hypothetical protein [Kiritimatiella glycovorans]AKJ65450.1 hypothetical protein L21SP4_02223 [Kiritimatiella glycovorans]
MDMDFNNMGFSVPQSNTLSGFGSAISVGGNYYRFDQSTPRRLTDMSALHSDWKAVGNDFSSCMSSLPAGFRR